MPFPFALPRDASHKLRIIQLAQLSITALTIVATFLTAVVPSKHKGFTFGFLYYLIFTSITTTFLVYKEQVNAARGTLTKDKYVKYQLFKIIAAVGLTIVAFVASSATPSGPEDVHRPGEQGWWINGVKVNKWQGYIMKINFFNWVFLWAGMFYSCCMTRSKQGPIALNGEEANIGLESDTANDEAFARSLQSQDPSWRA